MPVYRGSTSAANNIVDVEDVDGDDDNEGEDDLADKDFGRCDEDENYVQLEETSSHQENGASTRQGKEDQNMNRFRDSRWFA